MKIGEYNVEILSNDSMKVGCQTVTREEVQAALREMNNWTPPPEFKVGDFVKVIVKDGVIFYPLHVKGKTGKIVKIRPEVNRIGVEFPEYHISLHNCDGATKNGHGTYIDEKNLTIVP